MISHNDLYKYIFDHVTSRQPNQTPCIWADIQGMIILAKTRKTTTVIRDLPKSRNIGLMIKLLEDGKIEEFNTIRRAEDMRVDLHKVNLSGKSLIGIDLHEANLIEAILVGSALASSNLTGTKLIDANLTGADLKGAHLAGANLTRANLSKADLRGADLKGMVDFTESNLTGADLRAADISGMINFNNAIIHNTDFTGSTIDKGVINLKGATIYNAKGLPYLESNEYLDALKSFSEAISRQFKTLHTSTFQVIVIEEKVKELVREVESIQPSVNIEQTRKSGLTRKFISLVEKVSAVLPDTIVFAQLAPFSRLIEVEKIIKAVG